MTRAARIAIAAGLVATAALVFAALALTLGSEDSAVSFDDVLARTLRDHLPAPALRAFAWLTHIGDPAALVTMTGVCGALLWRLREYRLLLCWLLAVGGNALINPALKHVFERARPPHEAGLTLDSGFSFPSGHSSGAMVTYGMLFVVALRLVPKAWHLPALLLAVAAIFTSGSSRIMLQVHFASDVAAGFASGFAWLAICVTGSMLASPRSVLR